MIMGTILIIPFPQILQMITSRMAVRAMSQSDPQLLIAEGDSVRPMAMIMGPVTMGGKNFITRPVPKSLINSASNKYRRPEQATPKQA